MGMCVRSIAQVNNRAKFLLIENENKSGQSYLGQSLNPTLKQNFYFSSHGLANFSRNSLYLFLKLFKDISILTMKL